MYTLSMNNQPQNKNKKMHVLANICPWADDSHRNISFALKTYLVDFGYIHCKKKRKKKLVDFHP